MNQPAEYSRTQIVAHDFDTIWKINRADLSIERAVNFPDGAESGKCKVTAAPAKGKAPPPKPKR